MIWKHASRPEVRGLFSWAVVGGTLATELGDRLGGQECLFDFIPKVSLKLLVIGKVRTLLRAETVM